MSDITKVYTDHALMDEIVYNTKKILAGLVLKNDTTANTNETSESINSAEYYVAIKSGNIDLYTIPITTQLLINYGFTPLEAEVYVDDRKQLVNALTEDQQKDLLNYLSDDYVNNYVEMNNYYRMLNGKANYHPEEDSTLSYTKISAMIWDDNKGKLVNGELAFTDYLSGFYGKSYVKVFNTETGVYEYRTMYVLSYSIFLHSIPVIYGDGTTDTIKITYSQFDDETFMDYYKDKLDSAFASEELLSTTSLEHLLDYQINTMSSIGIIDDLKSKFITNNTVNNSKFRYLKYLGSKRIEIYNARSAANWDILYIPNVEYLVESRFKELFVINRDIYERRTYQDAYKLKSDYYDEILMTMIIAQTFCDIVVDIPEWYIRRDIFDLRSVKYFLDSQGVEYYKEIPLKYQIRIVKNLNKLIKYKSTEKNIEDILNIFSIDNAEIYKYYILKKYLYTDHTVTPTPTPDPGWHMDDDYDFGFQNEYIDMDDDTNHNTSDGHGGVADGFDDYDFVDEDSGKDYGDIPYDFNFGGEEDSDAPDSGDTDREDEYDESKVIVKDECDNVYGLQFVKVPVEEQYDDYIKDSINRKDYDTITENDPYWDGIDLHSLVKNNHLRKDFTIEGTKYLGIEYDISMKEYKFETAYFIGMIFNSNIHMDDISIPMSSIKENGYFTLQSLFVFLYCCNRLYEEKSLDIFDPTTLERTGAKPDYDAYIDCDGGRPWNNSSDPQPPVDPTPVDWEVPDIDGGDEEDPTFVVDQTTEDLDFGNGDYVIDPTEVLYDYNYDEITDTSIEDPAIIAQEKAEPANWPIQEDLDYGNEDDGPVYRSQYTVDYDFATDDTSTDMLLYDYNNEVYNQTTDLPEVGDAELTYYVESADLTRFAIYRWDTATSAYVLLYELEHTDPAPVITDGKITVTLTALNYKTYLNHYVINDDDTLTQLTEENAHNYFGKRVELRYPWYYEEVGYLGTDMDGHTLMQDSEHQPLYYDTATTFYKRISDDKAAVGTISPISDVYVQDYDGGGIDELNFESYYDWLRSKYPYFYTDLTSRVLGFNMYIDPSTGKTIKDIVATNIGVKHSIFGWDRGYTLEEIGCDSFIVKTSFDTITELVSTYSNNKKCYDTLRELMMNATTRDSYMVYKYAFDQFFTRPYDKNFYVLSNGKYATNFLEVLKDKDTTLYNYYIVLSTEKDKDTRVQQIRDCLNNIVSTLSYYLSDDSVKYVLSFIYTNSFDSLLYYMSLLLNFFKSWKTYFLNSVVSYKLDDKNDHNAIGRDTMNEIKTKLWTTGNSKPRDSFQSTVIRTIDETPANQPTREKEIIDIAAHYVDNDITADRDYDGGTPSTTEYDEDEIINGGGVTKLSCSPSYQIEGRGIADRLNVYDVDGGFPKNNKYYLDIDGLEVTDQYSKGPVEGLYGEDQDLGVDVDGGHPNFRQVMTNSAVTKADDKNNITVDARISTYDNNCISIETDGLYLDDVFEKTATVMDLIGDMYDYKESVKKTTDAYITDLLIVSDPVLAQDTINQIYKQKFAGATKVLNTFKYTDFETSTITKRNAKITDFRAWFRDNNPFEYEKVE